jgi:hypothetical protein
MAAIWNGNSNASWSAEIHTHAAKTSDENRLAIPELILNPSSDPSVAAVALAGIAKVLLLLLDAELVVIDLLDEA